MKVFGRPGLGTGTTICTMGGTAESRKKLLRLEERRRSLDYWCECNSQGISPKHKALFKNEPVSFTVTFDGKSDFGTLHPTSCVSSEASRVAQEILQKYFPITTPPNDLPYRRGLLIRLSSSLLSVKLAPEKF